MDISRLLFALITSTIILLATAGIAALAIIAANEDNEKASGGTADELAKGILAAIKVCFFLAISVMVFIFVYYMI